MTVSLLENVNLLILSLHLAHLYCKSIAEWLPYVETAPISPASCGIYVSSSVQRFHSPVHTIFETLQLQKQELNFYAFPLSSNLVTSVLEALIFSSRLNLFSPCIGLFVHRDLLLSPWNHTLIYFLFPNQVSFLITTFRLIIPHFSCFGFGPFGPVEWLLGHSYHPLILTPATSVPIQMLPPALGFPCSNKDPASQ